MVSILASLTLVLPLLANVCMAGFYDRNPNVIELQSTNFDEFVYETNYTTIVEFYAPWCGHCKNLKPVYQKVGKASEGIFQVAAVNCDEQKNKALCSKMQVKGFPTLMVFRPAKYDPNDPAKNAKNSKTLKHIPEVYNGARTVQDMVSFVSSRIKNYVKRISNTDKLKTFVDGRTITNKNKVVLLTNKNKPTPLLKSIAIDYMSDLEVSYALVDDKNRADYFEFFGLDDTAKLPTLIAIDKKSDEDRFEVYNGSFDKPSLSAYLLNFGTPLEGPASEKALKHSKSRKNHKKGSKKKSASHKKDRDEL